MAEHVLHRALVLGPLQVERGDVRIAVTRWQARVQSLFKLLVTAPERQRRREELIDLLWPDADPETGAGNLRLLVHRLRLALGGDPSPVLSGGGWVSLNPIYGWELDLDRLEALLREAHGDLDMLEAAANLYRGEPFIENRYEEWAAPIRLRAMQAWREACLQLSTGFRVRGQFSEAVTWCERLLISDPLDEQAMRELLSALAADGRPTDALARYRGFVELLEEELGVEPSAQFEAIVQALRTQRRESLTGVLKPRLPVGGFLGALPEGRLVGRRGELERMTLAIEAVAAGAGRVLMLTGEAGVGKTRLAQETMLLLQQRSILIATARCYERDRSVPFVPMLDALAQVFASSVPAVTDEAVRRWPQLAWLLPEGVIAAQPPGIESPDDERALFVACRGLVDVAAQERPVALLLDDLQWADEGTLALLAYLARETRGSPVMILGAFRDGEVAPDHPMDRLLRDLARERLVERLALARLDPDETAAIVAELFGREPVPTDFVEFVYRRTKGNPFFMTRMVHALGGRYRLVRQIASGGMGRVFEAIDTRTDERVAAKLMFARTEADATALLRFRQEAVILARVEHRNVVRILDTVVEEHASCIVMELLDGRSLADLIREEEFSLERIKRLSLQILAALACSHERGIVHRDIKPGNIVVTPGDIVKVTDFGIARLLRPQSDLTTMTSTGMALGTPIYMAPEQITAGRIDGRTDIYALGAVLYELVSGHPPFAGDDPLAVAFKHVNEPPVPLRIHRPGLPEGWQALILRCLAKDPVDRFQSATSLEQAIQSLDEADETATSAGLNGSMVTSRTERATGQIIVGARGSAILLGRSRRRRLALPVAGAMTVMIVSLAGLFWRGSGGASASGLLRGPTGLTVDALGNTYVVDQGNDRVQEFSPRGASVGRWGTKGNGLLEFDSPSDIALNRAGQIYISDTKNGRIEKLHRGQQIDEFQRNAGSLAVDNRRGLYATDYHNHRIWRLDESSGAETGTLAVPSIYAGAYPFPAGIATDRDGNLYIADREHDRIVKLSSAGRLLASFGSSGEGPGRFRRPSDVTLDTVGDIYIADTYNDRIQKLSPVGAPLAAWGTSGSRPGQFHRPVSLAVDSHGNIHVADYFNNRIQTLSPAGRVLWTSRGDHPETYP